jgi:hypothetical protein
VSFADIETVIGMPLPGSCPRHPAHWSSHDGSAVARAIQDAGWTAADRFWLCQGWVVTLGHRSKVTFAQGI